MIYEVGFIGIVLFLELIVSFGIALTNHKNASPYCVINELIPISI